MSRAGLRASDTAQGYRAVVGALCSLGPAVLFGLRLWAAVCPALYVAFWLELDNTYWAGTTAAIVCQPSLGASLRKGSLRMIGTVLGAVAIVVLTAYFPQNRFGFLVGLSVWGAMCGFIATLLRNFASLPIAHETCSTFGAHINHIARPRTLSARSRQPFGTVSVASTASRKARPLADVYIWNAMPDSNSDFVGAWNTRMKSFARSGWLHVPATNDPSPVPKLRFSPLVRGSNRRYLRPTAERLLFFNGLD
jgi:Fusaric acid resistance protein family